MFNNKEIQFFDEDKMRTMQNKYIEDYFESLAKKNEGIEEDLIKIKGNLYSTEVQTFTAADMDFGDIDFSNLNMGGGVLEDKIINLHYVITLCMLKP
ncbi:hypothetical protein Tco_0320210 [Tanacetum coccineum]